MSAALHEALDEDGAAAGADEQDAQIRPRVGDLSQAQFGLTEGEATDVHEQQRGGGGGEQRLKRVEGDDGKASRSVVADEGLDARAQEAIWDEQGNTGG